MVSSALLVQFPALVQRFTSRPFQSASANLSSLHLRFKMHFFLFSFESEQNCADNFFCRTHLLRVPSRWCPLDERSGTRVENRPPFRTLGLAYGHFTDVFIAIVSGFPREPDVPILIAVPKSSLAPFKDDSSCVLGIGEGCNNVGSWPR
jgi:hypothetical protein